MFVSYEKLDLSGTLGGLFSVWLLSEPCEWFPALHQWVKPDFQARNLLRR